MLVQNGISFVELSARLHFVNKHDFMRTGRGGTLMNVGVLPRRNNNMAMDAGKFNFKNVGGANVPPKAKQTTAGGPKESPSVQQDPSESVQIGAQSVADAKTDQVTTGEANVKAEAPTTLNVSSAPSSIPSQIGDFLIAGPSSSGKSRPTYDGITAMNGLGSSVIQTAGGNVVASVNPLNPKSPTRVPTTSLSLVNGIEDQQWITTSGRVISA